MRRNSARARRSWILGVAGCLVLCGVAASVALSLDESRHRPTLAPDAHAAASGPGAAVGVAGHDTASGPAHRADPDWIAQVATATGIPKRALTGYAEAALRTAAESPDCGLGWNTLAAIGLVESGHGSIHGAVLGADGRALPTITGPALDGTAYDAIPDTDGGALDGDRVWDRAVGPMQFLPATWQAYGRSAAAGTEPRAADPNQIDDAAWAAATMLCDTGGDLTQPDNWIRAVTAYNPNAVYNNDVADAADAYAASAAAVGL